MEPVSNNGSQTLQPAKLDKEGNINLSLITQDDARKYGEISKNLNPADVNSILNYGVETHSSMET